MKKSGCAFVGAAALIWPASVPAADAVRPVAGPPVMVEPACSAVFHELPDGQGQALERGGPEQVPNIRHLRYTDGRSLDGRVLSVTTGPGAVLKLYDGKRFHFPMFEVAPDSRVNLALPVMDSYVLRCVPPTGPAPGPGFK